jgi:hypothetical protein
MSRRTLVLEVVMFQRKVHRSVPGVVNRRRPPWRLLVESPEPGIEISNFDAFRCAGFEVTLCQGPLDEASECPVVRGEPCPLVAEADVVFFDLDSDPPRRSEVLAAMRANRPDLPIVVRSSATSSPAVHGCATIAATTSVSGQVAALQKAALRWSGRQA